METRVKSTHGKLAPRRRDDDVVSRGIAQWRAERPDIDSSGKAVIGRLLHLQGVVLQTVNTALAPHGLKYQEYAVLATLRVAGAPFQMTPSNLKSRLLFTSGGLSNLLKRLEASAWITRCNDPSDGRGVLVSLTIKGRNLADVAMPDHARAELQLLGSFPKAQRDLLGALLARLMRNQATHR